MLRDAQIAYGCYLVLVEYGGGRRCGFIVILKGLEGKGCHLAVDEEVEPAHFSNQHTTVAAEQLIWRKLFAGMHRQV